MKIYCDVNGNKRYEDDEGNTIELTGAELEIAESSNAGGEVDIEKVIEILRKYQKRI